MGAQQVSQLGRDASSGPLATGLGSQPSSPWQRWLQGSTEGCSMGGQRQAASSWQWTGGVFPSHLSLAAE
jgi:hypothetical protein